jgi:tetraacyldisaccharide 4'-kinase
VGYRQRIFLRAHTYVKNLFYTDSGGVVSQVLLSPLALAGEIYFLGTRLRRALYRRDLLRRARVDALVIGMGNLTLGGSGKTTLSMELAEYLKGKGCKVAVLSRGYRAKRASREPLVVSHGEGALEDVARAGDEAYMMAERLGDGVVVMSGKDRVKSARKAIDEFKARVLILDDSFQYLRLFKDLEFLLLHEADLQRKIRPLPRGPFREPLSSGRCADMIVIVRAPYSNGGGECETLLSALGKKVIEARPKEVRYRSIWPEARDAAPGDLKGKRILAFASIARAGAFRDLVTALCPEWTDFVEFPDHHHYDRREILALSRTARQERAVVLTTEKDRVKVNWNLFGEVACYTAFPRYGVFDVDTELKRAVDRLIECEESRGVQDRGN